MSLAWGGFSGVRVPSITLWVSVIAIVTLLPSRRLPSRVRLLAGSGPFRGLRGVIGPAGWGCERELALISIGSPSPLAAALGIRGPHVKRDPARSLAQRADQERIAHGLFANSSWELGSDDSGRRTSAS